MRMQHLLRSLDRARRAGLRSAMSQAAHRVVRAWFEFRLGMSTTYAHASSAHLPDARYHPYSPASCLDFLRAMRWVSFSREPQVFVDFGSGKGRIVLLAATYRFRRVIGLEFLPELNAIARENLDRARRRLRCADVELVTADATSWPIPRDMTVAFFYNPFHGDLLSRVLDNIESSLRAAPRDITILFANPLHFEEEAAARPWLAKVAEFRGRHPYAIFRALCERIDRPVQEAVGPVS